MKTTILILFSFLIISCQNSKSWDEIELGKEVTQPIKYTIKENNKELSDSLYQNKLNIDQMKSLFLNLEILEKGTIYPLYQVDVNGEKVYTFIYDKDGIELYYDDLLFAVKEDEKLKVIFSETLIPDEYGSFTEVTIRDNNVHIIKCNLEYSPDESYDGDTEYQPTAEHLIYKFSPNSDSFILIGSTNTDCPN